MCTFFTYLIVLTFIWYGPSTTHPHITNPIYNIIQHTRNLIMLGNAFFSVMINIYNRTLHNLEN